MGQEIDKKSKMVLEICSLSTSTISCVHKYTFKSPIKSHFIDWYRLLGVEENADVEVIRKRYHELALLLHPDKNRHPNADVAFKLVLEAYSCLIDNVKRRAFNLERSKNFCIACNRIPYASPKPLHSSKASQHKAEQNPLNSTTSSKIPKSLRDIGDRFREEVKVMEKCLRASNTRRDQTPLFNRSDCIFQDKTNHNNCRLRRESPVFNPSDYLFDGYPHVRNRVSRRNDKYFWYSRKQNGLSHENGNDVYDTPLYDNRSDGGILKSKSACVRS